MIDLLSQIDLFPVILTLVSFWIGRKCQLRWNSPLLNPILIGAILVIGFLLATGMELEVYKAGVTKLTWLMTPATVSIAIPMYEQLQVLKKNAKAILVGVASGAVSCIGMVMVVAAICGMDRPLIIALMPKSVTNAIGVPLCELYGGISAVSAVAIVITGVFANIMGTKFCKWFRITNPVAQGVAYGTSGHLGGTARAEELDPLIGAVSSVSLVTAGILTAVLFPVLTNFVV